MMKPFLNPLFLILGLFLGAQMQFTCAMTPTVPRASRRVIVPVDPLARLIQAIERDDLRQVAHWLAALELLNEAEVDRLDIAARALRERRSQAIAAAVMAKNSDVTVADAHEQLDQTRVAILNLLKNKVPGVDYCAVRGSDGMDQELLEQLREAHNKLLDLEEADYQQGAIFRLPASAKGGSGSSYVMGELALERSPSRSLSASGSASASGDVDSPRRSLSVLEFLMSSESEVCSASDGSPFKR